LKRKFNFWGIFEVKRGKMEGREMGGSWERNKNKIAQQSPIDV